jgi:hypothetical protein
MPLEGTSTPYFPISLHSIIRWQICGGSDVTFMTPVFSFQFDGNHKCAIGANIHKFFFWNIFVSIITKLAMVGNFEISPTVMMLMMFWSSNQGFFWAKNFHCRKLLIYQIICIVKVYCIIVLHYCILKSGCTLKWTPVYCNILFPCEYFLSRKRGAMEKKKKKKKYQQSLVQVFLKCVDVWPCGYIPFSAVLHTRCVYVK